MRIFTAHRKDVHGLAFAHDGRTLASVGGQSWAALVWDVLTGQLVCKLPGCRLRARAVACGPGGLVAAADEGNVVRVWRLPAAVQVAGIVLPPRSDPPSDPESPQNGPHFQRARDLAFVPDGSGLVTAAEHLRIWDLAATDPSYRQAPIHHKEVWDKINERETTDPPYRQAPIHHREFLAVGVSPDGARVAFATKGGAVGCWWPATGGWRPLEHVGHRVHSLAFAPVADELAVAVGHAVRVFDLAAGRPRLNLAGHQGTVWKVAYTPDGARLVTASSDGSVRFWDAGSGAARGSFDWQTGKVRCVAVAPDGLTVASGGQDGRIVIADVDP